MLKYILTNKAVEDLTTIWNYTCEHWSEQQADHYYKMLISNCKEIAKNPDLGRKYIDIQPDLLGKRINRHIIFYRKIGGARVEITRILHGRMDLKTRILE